MNMQMQYYDEEFSAEEEQKSDFYQGRYGYNRSPQMTYSRNKPYSSNNHMMIYDEERSNKSRVSYYDDEDTSVRGGGRNPASRYRNGYPYPNSPDYHHPMRKSFSEKVLSLLHEVKVMKDELSSSRITNGPRSNNTTAHQN